MPIDIVGWASTSATLKPDDKCAKWRIYPARLSSGESRFSGCLSVALDRGIEFISEALDRAGGLVFQPAKHLDKIGDRLALRMQLELDLDAGPRAGNGVMILVERDLGDRGELLARAFLPLSAERLFGWHSALFPTGRSGMRKIIVGA